MRLLRLFKKNYSGKITPGNFLSLMASSKKILIIRNGLVGDMVFITPLIIKLKELFPSVKIDLITGSRTSEIFNNFSLNRIYELPKKFSVLQQIFFFLRLWFNRYDIAFVQEVNSHYVLMAAFTGAKYLIGYDNKLTSLLDYSIKRKGHAVAAEQLHINKLSGTEIIASQLIVNNIERKTADKFLTENGLNKNGNLICIHISCSESKSVREWDNKKWAELADILIEKHNAQIFFSGIESDKEKVESVRSLMKNKSISLAGKTSLRMLIAILEKTKLVVGPDTGTLHIANAVGTPVIMLIGYADPYDTGPFDLSGKSKFIRADLPCIPCKFKNPKPAQWEICKHTRPTKCMELIQVNEVLEKVNIIFPL